MDAAAELGRNPVSKHQIQPEYGDEQADAGGFRDQAGMLLDAWKKTEKKSTSQMVLKRPKKRF